ncbi:hypothetical protein L596_014753 [Steinernema carpocapsae]|uniref:Saposin B-type domain-containing protein n=1 Tax=Steinernema carpocapsae TaxID=34508 RepID=A0A4U5NDN3_STECR|nr:hypothetical protein L596_014753 [Steinernema carpocapsae]
MLRLVLLSAIPLLLLSNLSALQFPISIQCKYCHELVKAVLPISDQIEAGLKPLGFPEDLWNALWTGLPAIKADPQCYQTCVNPQVHFAVPTIFAKQNVTCVLCQTLIKTGANTATQEKFIERAKQTCEHTGGLLALCLTMVSDYGAKMFELEQKKVAPIPACQSMALC